MVLKTSPSLPIYGLALPDESDAIELQVFTKSDLAEILAQGFEGSDLQKASQIESIRVRLSRDSKLIYGEAALDRELTYRQCLTLYCVAVFRLAMKSRGISRVSARQIRAFLNQPNSVIYDQIRLAGASPEEFKDRVARWLLSRPVKLPPTEQNQQSGEKNHG